MEALVGGDQATIYESTMGGGVLVARAARHSIDVAVGHQRWRGGDNSQLRVMGFLELAVRIVPDLVDLLIFFVKESKDRVRLQCNCS